MEESIVIYTTLAFTKSVTIINLALWTQSLPPFLAVIV